MKPSVRTATLLRLAVWGMLLLWTLLGLDRPIGDGDECVHAQVLREMLRSGDYLHTRWYGAVLYNHPPLAYWLAAPFAHLIEGEVGVRLSSALMSFATLVVVYRTGYRLWGQATSALTGAILLAAAPSFHVYTRTLLIDGPLSLALLVALIGTLRAQEDKRGLRLAAGGLGAAFAIKSFAAAIPFVALLPWWVLAARRHADRRSILQACGLFALLASSYFLLGLWDDPQQFWREHIGFHLLQRAQGGPYGLRGDVLFYVTSTLYRDGAVICAVLATGIVGAVWLGLAERRALLLLGSYGLLFLVGMSLVQTRLSHYLLPLYPAAMLAFIGVLAHGSSRVAALQRPLWQFGLPAVAWAVLLISTRYHGAANSMFERPYGRILGRAAHALSPDQPIYVYEWYGPSLGYYADRRITLVTARKDRYESINFPYGVIHKAGIAALVPPLPAAEGETIIVAGLVAELHNAQWFEVKDVLAAAPPYFLARARVGQAAPELGAKLLNTGR